MGRLLFISILALGSQIFAASPQPRAVGGVLDLRETDFSKRSIELKGEWLFYWAKLRSEIQNSTASQLANVPKSWNGIVHQGASLPGFGFGTYRLTILLPAARQRLAIRMNEQGTAANIHVNGVLLGSRGVVGRSQESSTPETLPLHVVTGEIGGTMILDLEISNFHYRKGGMWSAVTLGTESNVATERHQMLFLEIFVAGTLLMIALYHFALSTYYRQDAAPIIFAWFCTALFLRLVTTGQRILPEIFPVVGYAVYSRIEYLSWFLSVPLGIHYVTAVFGLFKKGFILRLVYAVGIIFSLSLILPSRYYSHTVLPSNVIYAIFMVYALGSLVMLARKSPAGLGLFIFGAFVLIAFSVNDILYVQEIYRFALLGPFGMLVFVFCQAILLSQRFLKVFEEKEKLQVDLRASLETALQNNAVELRFAREASEVSRQQFDSVVRNIPGITYRAEPTRPWRMYFMSMEFERITGLAIQDYIGEHSKGLRDLMYQEEFGDRELAVGLANSADPRFRATYRLRCKDGREVWVEDRGQKIYDSSGKLLWLDGVLIDISLRKQIEGAMEAAVDKAEAANQAKSQFLATMSHELRTPLHGVIGMISLLQNTVLTDEQKEYIELIEKSGTNLLTLINQILDLAKIESGTLELDSTAADVSQLVQETCLLMKLQSDAKGLGLNLEIEDDLGQPVLIDTMKFRQILINLIGNAIKFTNNGAIKVHISIAAQTEETVTIRGKVTDTGIGLTPEQIVWIFEPFRQGDGSTSRKYGGTGLGLAITRQLLDQMDGKIDVESSIGKGTTFNFSIPVKIYRGLDGIVTSGPKPAINLQDGKSFHILVADDDPVNREICGRMLRHLGYEFSTAVNGVDVITACEASRPDLILLDIMMPEKDGYQTAREIRSSDDSGLRRIPIIAVSANAMKEDREKCKETGMNDFLAKPFTQLELQALLQKFLP